MKLVESTTTKIEKYLSFNVAQDYFAIPLLSVKEVIPLPELTTVPQTPSHFLGIINLRGHIISVLDLKAKLNIKSSKSEEPTVMILNFEKNLIGVLVDSVNSVISLDAEKILSPPTTSTNSTNEFVTGVYQAEDQLVLILNIFRLFFVKSLGLRQIML